MAVNLTSGVISKMMAGKYTENDSKPVLQVTDTVSLIRFSNGKQWYRVWLSDGSSEEIGLIADEIFISNKLQEGDIVQLTKFRKDDDIARILLIDDLNVIHSKCDIIVNPERFPCNDIPLVERSTPPITDEDHVDVSQSQEHVTSTQNCSETQSKKRKVQSSNETPEPDTYDDVHNSQNAQEPSATTQKCSSQSLSRSKKRKRQSSNDNTTKVVEDVSKLTKLAIEKNKLDDVGACFKKLETLEEDVSKMARMMTEKNKEDEVGACFKKLETLEIDISKVSRTIMEKYKDDDVGGCFKKLETLEEVVSKLMRMMMEQNKEDDVYACFKKLETLENDISKVTSDVGACFKKLETLDEDVLEMKKMMMEKNKEDDMGACIEKLDKLEWEAEDPLYDTALLLFGQSADYRKLWLHLKPESCDKWVKNAGSMFGLLD